MHSPLTTSLLGAALLILLAGCGGSTPSAAPSAVPSGSTSASPSATPTSTIKPSDSLAAITVDGDTLGKKPKVSVKKPWAIDKTRVRVLIEGKGPVVNPEFLFVHYLGLKGRDGKEFDASFTKAQPTMFNLGQVVPGFKIGLENQRVGSRVLIAMPGKDGYDSGGGNPQAGIELGDTLIFVVDIVDTVLAGPTGKPVKPANGLPTVTEANGKPVITIPKADPPTAMQVQPLTTGSGREVGAKDIVAVHYLGVSWKTGKVFEDKYAAVDGGALASTIPGWQKGLLGKKVGQRVLLVLPPKDSYPQGSNNPPVEAGDTVVYVVDLLYAAAGGA